LPQRESRSATTVATVPSKSSPAGNEVWGQENDNIQLGIANDVIVEDNVLHDLQVNPNHNDGVQSIGGRGLVIRRNRFWNQDQAVMLNATPSLAPVNDVVGARIENNLVHHTRNAASSSHRRVTSRSSTTGSPIHDTPAFTWSPARGT